MVFEQGLAVRLLINIDADEVVVLYKPKRWLATVLCFFMPSLGFLYLGRPALGLLAIGLQLVIAGCSFVLPDSTDLQLTNLALTVVSAMVAYWLASKAVKASDARPQPWYARWYGLIGVLLLIAMVFVPVRIFFVEPFSAPSTSMVPTIPGGSNLLVQKWGYGHYSTFGAKLITRPLSIAVERGDVIAFDYPVNPANVFVKRVVGLPGDLVEYRDKHVFINGSDTRGKRLDDYLLAGLSLKFVQRYRERLAKSEHDIVIEPDVPAIFHDQQSLPADCVSANDTLRCKVPAGAYFVMGDNRDNSKDSRYWGFVPSGAIVGKVVAIFPPTQ